jgi:NADPH-ferrihemoprotein reductase
MGDNASLKIKEQQTAVPEAAEVATTSGINANTVVLGLFVLAVIYFLMPGGKKKKVPTGLNAGPGKKAGVVAGPGAKAAAEEEDDEESWTYKLKAQDKRVAVFYGSQTGTAQEYALKWAKEARSKFGLSSLVLDPETVEFNVLNRVPKDKAVVFVMASYGEGEPTDNAEVSR